VSDVLRPGALVPLFGEYALDPARGCLLRGADRIHLRPQSFAVLSHLIENRGRLVGKEELIAAVWEGRAVTDDSLVQCLRDVRQALGPGADRYITTVRGRGYIFESGPNAVPALPVPSQGDDLQQVIRVVVEEAEEALAVGSPSGEQRRRPFVVPAAVAAGLVLATVGTLALLSQWRSDRALRLEQVGTIAVLPFTTETSAADADYVSNGVSESLVQALSQLPGVTVKARSAVFRYRGDIDVRRAAADLSVDAVVTGWAAQRGDQISLYVSLVDGRTGNQLWGAQYHRRLTELVALQRDIVRDVSGKLRTQLSAAAGQPGVSIDPAAYQAYLRGRFYSRSRFTRADVLKGIAYLEEAIALDPGLAAAHSALALAFRRLPIAYNTAPLEAFPAARIHATRALELDPRLADPHVELGWVAFWFDWNWTEAERHVTRAIELDPTSPYARLAYAHLLSNTARHEEALLEARRGVELDPVDPMAAALEGQFLMYADRPDDAARRFTEALELQPDFWIAVNGLARVDITQGRFDQAVAKLQHAAEQSLGSAEPLTQLGYALARAGRRREALDVIADLEGSEGDVPMYGFAMIYNGLGERTLALDYLERAVLRREVQLTFINVDSRWDQLRVDPRFAAIVARLNFPGTR
jgi:DNA-binding winged helix-turn-helix (wHTH) protein/TolB-like protein/Flp pilus assembly protein TadD